MTSGNGVKVAKFIRENQVSSYSIKDIRVKDFTAQTGIKALRVEIEQMIRTELDRQSNIRQERRDLRYVSSKWHKNRILSMLDNKKRNLVEWQRRQDQALPLSEALSKPYRAAWNEGATLVRFGDNILRITWDEDSDWDYYAKSYGRPKNTYSNRRVELLTFGGHESLFRLVDTYPVERFSGSFLVEAIAKFSKLEKINVAKGLQPVQLNPYFAVRLIRDIAGVQIYERTLAGNPVDYCAVYRRETYHAETEKATIDGLRKKLQAKADFDAEKITYETGRKLGFCHAGISEFAYDNGLDIDGTYTRAELRNIVIQRRLLNAQKYQKELAKLGIRITE